MKRKLLSTQNVIVKKYSKIFTAKWTASVMILRLSQQKFKRQRFRVVQHVVEDDRYTTPSCLIQQGRQLPGGDL